eukprot:5149009-Pleurochrysis_carterae.AAC.1
MTQQGGTKRDAMKNGFRQNRLCASLETTSARTTSLCIRLGLHQSRAGMHFKHTSHCSRYSQFVSGRAREWLASFVVFE